MKKLVAMKRDKVFDGVATGIVAGWGKVIHEFGGIVAVSARSDSWQQRLSTINSEIERQLTQAPAREKRTSG